MTRAGCLDRIDTLLSGVTGMTPAFVAISRGEPLGSPPALPWCAFWVSGLSVISDMNTLSDESTITTITIRSYHPVALAPEGGAITLDIWDAIAGIRVALLADANLSGNCSQIQINDATVDAAELNGVYHYQSTQTLDVWILGDTPVSP